LSAGGDVGAPKVGDNRNSESLGEYGGVPQLHRISRLRQMTHRLAVAADCTDEVRRDSAFPKQPTHGLGIDDGELNSHQRRTMKLAAGWGLQGEERGLEFCRIRNERRP
jgi:hypothetical protein